jgi:hypothetical protein
MPSLRVKNQQEGKDGGHSDVKATAFALFGSAVLAGVGGCTKMSPSDKANLQTAKRLVLV